MAAARVHALHLAACALAWGAGLALQLQQPALWSVACNAGSVAAGGALMAIAWGLRPRRMAWPVLWLALALLAFGSTAWRAQQRLADALPAALEGRDLQLVGVVASLPQTGAQGLRFVLDVEAARDADGPLSVPRRVSLGWYPPEDFSLGGSALPLLRAGQRWQLPVRLRQPHGSLNPQGFDFELWLFEQGIRASGTVRSGGGAQPRLLAEGVAYPVERWRQRIRDGIQLQVRDAQAAGVLAALAVGDQAAIDRDDWEIFRNTGVAHLMSISGLHVTLFAWLAAVVIGAAWRLSPRLLLACPAPVAARWGGVLAAAAYALLAGWGVPAQRTVWMLATVALLRSAALRWPAPLVLAAAAVVVSALDPWALLQPGFWLSFLAVALLMASEPASPSAPAVGRWARLRGALRGGVRTQLVATVGLAPLTLVFFQQVSLVGFVANLVAIPVVTLLIMPLSLLGVLLPPLWTLGAWAVQALVAWLGWLAQWPLAVWEAAAAPPWALAGGLLGGLVLVLPLPWRLRWLGLPLMLPLLAPPVARPPEGRFEAVVADVGQGTAVLLRTREHLLVYDAGPQYSREADAGQRVLLPLLRARGERAVHLLMLSHRDIDHVGGAASLLQGGRVRALASSLEDGHPLRATGLPHQRCEAGQRWQWDGVGFEVLHPLATDYDAPRKPNALSCVLRVMASDGRSLLLTGDVEAAQEQALVARAGSALRSEVLLVPHHGSKTSSTLEFLQAVAPRSAVVQAAYRSRFGHPAPPVLARYQALGIAVQRTDACGAWGLAADGSAVCERERARRYWHHRPPAPALDGVGAPP